MPKIPTYPDSGVSLDPKYFDVAGAGAGARQLGELGGQVSAWAVERLEVQRKAADLSWLTTTLADTRQAWTERLLKAQAEAPAGAPDFTETLIGGYDEHVRSVLERAPSPEARANAEERLSDYRTALLTDAVTFEGRERGRKTYTDQVDVWNRNAATLRRDPTQFNDIVLETVAGIRAMPTLSAAQKGELERDAKADYAAATAYALIDRNPRGAKESILTFGEQGYLDPGRVETLLRAADAEEARQDAERRERAREARAAFLADFAPKLADERAARARGQSTGLTDLAVLSALGEQEGGQEVKELRALQEAAIAATALSLLPDDEQDALIAGKTPEGEDFRIEAPLQEAYLKARADLRAQKAADPAGYVLTYSPGLQAAYDKAAQSGEERDRRRAIEMSLALQAGAGVPEWDRRVLSKPGAKAAVDEITGLQGERAADAVQRQRAFYGDNWQRVQRELIDAGLPAPYQVLAAIDRAGVAKTLAEVLALPEKDVRPLDSAKAKDIADKVDDRLADFAATLELPANGSTVLAAWRDAAQRLAWRYGQGSDAGDASARAVDELLGGWDFVLEDQITARAPAGRGDELADKAMALLENLTAFDLADPGGREWLEPDERQAAMLEIVRREGRWWTNENDTAWILLDPKRQPVLDRAGQPIVLPFQAAGPRLDPRRYLPSGAFQQ